jgi:hypothetical protein
MPRVRAVSTVAFLLALLPLPAYAQTAPCDPELRPPVGDPYAYRPRDGRCEGVYARDVGLATLLVASLTSSFAPFDPAMSDSIVLTWQAPQRLPVHVRAHGLRRRLYYRMDAELPAAQSQWSWPAGLLAALQLGAADIGVVAWTELPAGDVARRVYLPLRVGARAGAPAAERITLVLVPGRELREAYLHLVPIDAAGEAGAPIRSGEPLGYGYYPADRRIDIELPALPAPGLYRVEVGAELAGGGTIATSLILYHRE